MLHNAEDNRLSFSLGVVNKLFIHSIAEDNLIYCSLNKFFSCYSSVFLLVLDSISIALDIINAFAFEEEILEFAYLGGNFRDSSRHTE